MPFLDKLTSSLGKSGAAEESRDPTVARVIRAVGGGIGSVRGCEERLADAIRHAEDYYTAIVEAIPGSVHVSAERLAEVPMLQALFPNPADLTAALGKSIEVKETVTKLRATRRNAESFYALLGVRRRSNGAEAGDAAADVPTAFTDHTLRSLGSDAEETRSQIREAAMQRLLKRFTARAEHLRKIGKMLRSEWEADLHPEEATRLGGAQITQHPSSHDFVHASRELTPEHLLDSLIAWLLIPDLHLRLVAPQTPAASGSKAGGLAPDQLPQLIGEDRRRWFVCVARFPAAEVLAAADQSAHAHRYILI